MSVLWFGSLKPRSFFDRNKKEVLRHLVRKLGSLTIFLSVIPGTAFAQNNMEW
jgi:hypothetical protein